MTVRDVVGHLLAVQERVRLLAADGTFGEAPTQVEVPADAPQAFRAAVDAALAAWDAWPAGDLGERTVLTPMGALPGAAAVSLYADENLVHGWDVAVATGQPAEAPADVAEPVLQFMSEALPAQRPPEFPFADAVEPAADAGPTERLANWTGRSR